MPTQRAPSRRLEGRSLMSLIDRSIRSWRVHLPANLAAGEIARSVGDRRHAVVRVHVDVCAAAPHCGDELRERMSFERADEIGGREVTFCQDAVVTAGA